MKKYVAVCVTLGALVWVGAAAAAAPQGKLTGSATVFGGTYAISATDPVIDGGTSYVDLENDKSGNCNGDSGSRDFAPGFLIPVVCAHYVASSGCCNIGSPTMRFATAALVGYAVYRITDNGASPDTFAAGNVGTLAQAQAWVNQGARGCHCGAVWVFAPTLVGDYTVTAAQ
jgi:hypothetical protein